MGNTPRRAESKTHFRLHGWALEAALIVYEIVVLWVLQCGQGVYEIAGGKRESLAILAAFAYLGHLNRFLRDPARCERYRVNLEATGCYGRSHDILHARQTRWDPHRRR